MSSISGLTVLALSLGRINLLKENMIQAELPFCKQKTHLHVAPSNQVSLLLSVVRAFHNPLQWRFVPLPYTGLHKPLRTPHTDTCFKCCPVIRWKKSGGSRSCETKQAATSIDPWAEDARFLFAGWKSLRFPSSISLTFPVFLLVLPARPLDSKVWNSLTEKQTLMLATKPQSHEIKYLLPLLEWINLEPLCLSKIPSSWADCAVMCSWWG